MNSGILDTVAGTPPATPQNCTFVSHALTLILSALVFVGVFFKMLMISRSTEFRLNLNTSILFLHTFQHTDCDDVQGPDDAHVSTGPPGAGEPAAGANLQLYGSLVPQPG